MSDCRINPSDPESLTLDFIDALLEGGEKQCPKCGKIKPAGSFTRGSTGLVVARHGAKNAQEMISATVITPGGSSASKRRGE